MKLKRRTKAMFVAGRQLRTLPYDCYDNNSNPRIYTSLMKYSAALTSALCEKDIQEQCCVN